MADDAPTVLCEGCGNRWEHCQCSPYGAAGRITAFEGVGQTLITLSVVEGTVIIGEGDKTILFADEDFSQLAQAWVANQEEDDDAHEHAFVVSLDPRYAICICGETRRLLLTSAPS